MTTQLAVGLLTFSLLVVSFAFQWLTSHQQSRINRAQDIINADVQRRLDALERPA